MAFAMPEADPTAGPKTLGFLKELPGALADKLIQRSHAVDHPAGSVIFRGEGGVHVALVMSGLLRSYLSAPDGRQITYRYAGAGDLIGTLDLAGLDVSRRVQSIAPSRLLHFDAVQLERLAKREPALAWQMIEELADRLVQAYRTLALRSFATVRWRVARDIIERAVAAGDLREGAHVRLTHQEVADATGSVREVAARAIRVLRRDGMIATVHPGVTILDLDRLLHEAGLGA